MVEERVVDFFFFFRVKLYENGNYCVSNLINRQYFSRKDPFNAALINSKYLIRHVTVKNKYKKKIEWDLNILIKGCFYAHSNLDYAYTQLYSYIYPRLTDQTPLDT